MTVAQNPGPLAAVAPVDVLDHLLAPLVLEVDVDVGRLLALLGEEALEQEVHLGRIDRGDPEHEADGRVRGRAPALAEDLLPFREADDVVDGEEVARVVEPRDQRQLLLQDGLDLRQPGPGQAQGGRLPDQVLQMTLRRLAGRDRLVGILVAQVGQIEADGIGDLQRPLKRRLEPLEETLDLGQGLRMTLGIGREPQPRLLDRHLLPDAGEHVLQGPPLGGVVEHVLHRHDGRSGRATEGIEPGEPAAVVTPVAMGGREIDGHRPGSDGAQGGDEAGLDRVGRDDHEDHPFGVLRHLLEPEGAATLR